MLKSKTQMYTFVSLLRGINVGGQKRIRMAELVDLYRSMGFENVLTYLQSGNVVSAAANDDPPALSKAIEARIRQIFDLSVTVILRAPEELHQIVQSNPFLKESGIDVGKLHVTFLSQMPAEPDLKLIAAGPSDTDRFSIKGREVYLYCPAGYGRTRFSNDYFERKLNVKATTRNWQTVNALWEMVRE
jgi:uncharacterized protein (DUF1697 family)